MEPSDIEAVLNFFRKNHLSVSESALIHDILDKSQLGSSDFHNFLFPPPLSPLKIPGRPPPPPEDLETSDDSSDQEFVSLGSSTTDLCSSDLTNPYGLKTLIRASSHASSDLLSQFGTARDYHEFDMQNDLCWYSQKDEDYAMPSCFHSSDPLGGPTEDKFVMTLEKENQIDDRILDSLEKTNSLDKACDLIKSATLCSSLEGIDLNGFHDIDIGIRSKNGVSCFEENDRSSNDYLIGDSKMIHEKDLEFNINGDYDAAKVEETDAIDTNDESLMNANGDEYEIFNLRIIHRKNRTGFEENKDLPIVLNSVIGSRYVVAEYLGSAAFSKVVQARDLQTGIDVCLKIIKNDKDFFDQSLDEIKLLKLVNKHDPADEHHILRLYDYFYFQEHLFIVSELLRANLYEFQKYNRESGGEPYFTLTRLQVITRQCLEALDYLHGLGIIHCDLKPENILIKSYSRCEIKVIDLGSSCFQNDKLSLYVQSRSYRAPEVIIGLPYNPKVDLWSLGCILAELSSGDVLFPNDDLVFLLARVIGMLGPIDTDMLMRGQETSKYFTDEYDLYRINQETNQLEYIFPQETSLEEHVQVSDTLFIDFLRELLEINPRRRPTAREALQHPWLSFPYET
ncbi:dual specificity tyrosine-phosphorylation-regulated kinase 4 [Cynara cardunculus var. scolymus]|uniref:Protein kinase, catalytic domain-containing protein n=1 Tax=Cynara cardunculus var. scolymus TaxID=59895 RepID=A0A103YIW6_CYNCS|nr:dual specificity tyrosine-phosphorylation-regulated kinase 4 [Cynara cardunculus var. scolymus]KVI09949.1 Protein kinase, catalytic domain-containing protein [Cynara cardunculus var. scolymus]